MEKLLELPVFNRHTHNAHKRLMERHEKHVMELRADILDALNRHTPYRADMKKRQERIDLITDDIVKVLIGDFGG